MWISKKKLEEKIKEARSRERSTLTLEEREFLEGRIKRFGKDIEQHLEDKEALQKSIEDLEKQIAELKSKVREQTEADIALEAMRALDKIMGGEAGAGEHIDNIRRYQEYVNKFSRSGSLHDRAYGPTGLSAALAHHFK